MGAIDKLKSLISIKGADLSNLKSVNLVKAGKDASLFKIEKVDQSKITNISINIGSSEFNEESAKSIKSVINDALNQDGIPILRDRVDQEVNLISSTTQSSDLVNFFRSKIDNSDLLILESSIYISEVYKSNRSKGSKLKGELIERYGERAKNISHLCSAGYFETYFMPLYKSLSTRPDFEIDEFKRTFDFIVRTEPFTVFVSMSDTQDDTLDSIQGKLARCQRYGIKQLNIHGISEENLKKIDNALDDENVKEFFSNSPTVTKKGDVVHVKIFIK